MARSRKEPASSLARNSIAARISMTPTSSKKTAAKTTVSKTAGVSKSTKPKALPIPLKMVSNPLFRAINNMDHAGSGKNAASPAAKSSTKASKSDKHVSSIRSELLTGNPKVKRNKPSPPPAKAASLQPASFSAKRSNGSDPAIPEGHARVEPPRYPLSMLNNRRTRNNNQTQQPATQQHPIQKQQNQREQVSLPVQHQAPSPQSVQIHQQQMPSVSNLQQIQAPQAPQAYNQAAHQRRIFSIKNASLPPIVVIKNLADGTSREDVLAVVEDIGPVADCRCALVDGIVMAEVTFVENSHATIAKNSFDGSFADGNRLSATITRHHQIADRIESVNNHRDDGWDGPPLYSDSINRKKRGIIRQ